MDVFQASLKPYNTGTMLPEQTVQVCNNKSCNTDFVNDTGLGLGRRYDNNSTKCGDWPSELPVNQHSNCCASNNNLFNYYNHIDRKSQGELVVRNSQLFSGDIMSGGDPKAYNL